VVERARPALQALVRREVLDQVPVQAACLAPLAPLPELLPHEEQLLAGMRHLIAKQQAQRGELLPPVAGNLANQRAFHVHHFVVRQREHEVLAEGVHQREGEQMMMPAPVDGVLADIFERVVHPAHVPLQGEAQPAQVRRARDHRPGRGLLGDGQAAGALAVNLGVGFLQEADGRQVLVAAVLVGHPLPCLAPEVEVDHRRDGVYAQRIHVIRLQPEQGVADQEVAHLIAGVVEDVRAPVRVLALARVGVLVEVRAVEIAQGVPVFGEVGRHPVEDDADAVLMALVNQVHQVVRRPVAAGGGEVAGHLVAPRHIERVLGDGHQLDVRVAHLLGVRHQRLGQLAVGQPLQPVRLAPPRAEMHLVDAQRRAQRVARGAGFHPGRIAPLVAVQVYDQRGGARAHLLGEAVGIGLLRLVASGARAQVVLVGRPFVQAGDEEFPDASVGVQAHGVNARVPAVEVADDADAVGVGRPHREMDAAHAVHFAQVRAKPLVAAEVPPFAEQVEVVVGQQRAEAIGVVQRLLAPVGRLGDEVVRGGRPRRFQRHGEEAALVQAGHGQARAVPLDNESHGDGGRAEGAHGDLPLAGGVRAEQGERVAMIAAEQVPNSVRVHIKGHAALAPGSGRGGRCAASIPLQTTPG